MSSIFVRWWDDREHCYEYKVGRVPVVGEFIHINGRDYKVTRVILSKPERDVWFVYTERDALADRPAASQPPQELEGLAVTWHERASHLKLLPENQIAAKEAMRIYTRCADELEAALKVGK